MHIHAYTWSVRNLEPYSGFMDPCGPQHVYVPCGHISLLFSIFFPILFFPKRHYHPPYHWQLHDRLSPSSQHHVWLHPPIFSCLFHILLLFVRTISPQFTCINRVDTTLYSTLIWVLCSLGQQLSKSLDTSSTAAIKHFDYYCQWLPSLTTKSTYYYPSSLHFRTILTFITSKDTATNAVLRYCATRPFGAQAHDATVIRCPNSHDLATHAHWLYNQVLHTRDRKSVV